ncbi:DUF4355 domain-containing protein, partial [Schinkia azotoformans]
TYLQGFKTVSVEEVSQLVNENEELKKWFDSERDKHFSKGLETYKQKSLPKLIDEEIKKRFPEADPKEVQLKQLEAEIEKMKQEKQYESLKNKGLTVATEKKLPVQLIDYFIGQDEETTIQNLTKFEEVFNAQLQTLVDEKLKSSGTNPKDGNPPLTFTKDQIAKMTPDEINKNWDAVQSALKTN